MVPEVPVTSSGERREYSGPGLDRILLQDGQTDRGCEKTSLEFHSNCSNSPPSLWCRNSGENPPCLHLGQSSPNAAGPSPAHPQHQAGLGPIPGHPLMASDTKNQSLLVQVQSPISVGEKRRIAVWKPRVLITIWPWWVWAEPWVINADLFKHSRTESRGSSQAQPARPC